MQRNLRTQLAVAIFCRFLLKTGRRFVYPFAALVSTALGVSLASITALLALNQLAALLSPFFGQLSDRWGHRTMIGVGLVAASCAMLTVGALPHYSTLMFGLLVIGVGISIVDPALHAYIGARVHFAQRGQAIGLVELAWAGSSLVGIPAAGFLINTYSWNTPFVVMGVLGLGGALLLRWLLPADTHVGRVQQPLQLLPALRTLCRRPAAQGMLLYALLISCASDIFFVTYALWLADSFQMGVMALGLGAVIIGFAELIGELLTATLADRIGLRRTVYSTLLATAACYALLPLWGFSSTGALVGIFLLCLVAEFNMVASMALCTEVRPTARASMMSAFQAASGVGHVVGVLISGVIWMAGGIAGAGLLCAALCLISFMAVWRGTAHFKAPLSLPTAAQPTVSINQHVTASFPLYLQSWYHNHGN